MTTLGSPRRMDHLLSAYVQQEWQVVEDRLRLSIGSKFERNSYTGFEFQPTGRLLWTPNPRQAGWLAVSRAVRTPSWSERSLRVSAAVFPGPFGLPAGLTVFGNPDFESEELLAHELGYRRQFSKRFSVDVAGFYNDYTNLLTLTRGEPEMAPSPPTPHVIMPSLIGNGGLGKTYGVEIAGAWDPTEWWRLKTAYSRLQIQVHSPQGSYQPGSEKAETLSPDHQVQLRSYMDLPRRIALDTSVYYVGRICDHPLTPGPTIIPGRVRFDVRLGWRPTERIELSLGFQDLLDNRHPEYVAEDGLRPTEIRHGVYGKLTWRY